MLSYMYIETNGYFCACFVAANDLTKCKFGDDKCFMEVGDKLLRASGITIYIKCKTNDIYISIYIHRPHGIKSSSIGSITRIVDFFKTRRK